MNVEKVIVKYLADATQFNAVTDGVIGRLSRFASAITGGISPNLFELALNPLKAGLAAVATLSAEAAFGAVRLAAEFENASVSFKVMTGSAERAKQVLGDLTKLAIETPFKSSELIKGAQTLKAYGVETEDLVDSLKVLGDVASGGSGGSLDDRLGRLVLAFGQTITQGKLMGQELRQFSNAGAPLIENIAKVIGRPVEAVRGMVEAGKIGTREVTQALNLMVGPTGRFFNLMEERSKTVEGRWSSFVENIQLGLRNLGLSFFKGFGLADLLDQWGTATQKFGAEAANLEGFFSRLREVFDLLKIAATAMGEVLVNSLGEVIKKMTGIAPTWTEFKDSMDLAIRAAIIGLGQLIEALGRVAKGMADVLRIAGEAAQVFGLGEGNKTTIYRAARAEGRSVLASTGISIGAGINDLFGGNSKARLTAQGRLDPSVNPFQGGIDTLNAVGRLGNPAPEMMKRYDELLAEEARKRKYGSGGFFDFLFPKTGSTGSNLAVRFGPSAEAMKMIGEINKAFAEGVGPLGKFREELKALRSAATNGLPEPLLKGLRLMGLAPIEKLSLRQQEFQAGRMLEQLRHAAGSHVTLPPFVARGTAEEQDVINRSLTGQKTSSIQEEIRELIKAQLKIQEEQLKTDKEALEEFKRMGFAIPGEI